MDFEIKVNEVLKKISKGKEIDRNMAIRDLGIDSLDLVEILMSLEDEFGISIPDEAIPEIKTIKDVVAFIENNKK